MSMVQVRLILAKSAKANRTELGLALCRFGSLNDLVVLLGRESCGVDLRICIPFRRFGVGNHGCCSGLRKN